MVRAPSHQENTAIAVSFVTKWLIHCAARRQPLWIGVSWFLTLVLVALWNCYCSLRTFSDLALVFIFILLVSF